MKGVIQEDNEGSYLGRFLAETAWGSSCLPQTLKVFILPGKFSVGVGCCNYETFAQRKGGTRTAGQQGWLAFSKDCTLCVWELVFACA